MIGCYIFQGKCQFQCLWPKRKNEKRIVFLQLNDTEGDIEHRIQREKMAKYRNTAKKSSENTAVSKKACLACGFVDARAKIEAKTSGGTVETMALL